MKHLQEINLRIKALSSTIADRDIEIERLRTEIAALVSEGLPWEEWKELISELEKAATPNEIN